MRENRVGGNGHHTECRNPATDEVLGYSPLHSPEEVAGFIRKAEEVHSEWSALPLKRKIVAMKKIRRYMVDHLDDLALSIARDNGKTRMDALATEVFPAIAALGYYCRKAAFFLKDRSVGPSSLLFWNKRSRIRRLPFGVVGVISPWNYPFVIPFSEVVMALLAGNCVVLKAATETQMAGLALKECLDAGGLPEGVFSYVNMGGPDASRAFLEHGVQKLFFTGSVSAGKQVAELAARKLIPVCLELGGNDAMLVCEDADLHRAASGALWAGFQNAGQSCGGVERVYVHKDVYAPFLEILKEKTLRLRVGYDLDHGVDVGCMTTLRQVETVQGHLADALEKGASVFVRAASYSGKDSSRFVTPVVLTEVDHSMKVMREETFGPVLAVMKVQDMDEGVRLANDSTLGLTCSVWSRNGKRAETLARKIFVGVATINDHLMSHGLPETPWGGPGETGGGRTHGQQGFDEMTLPSVLVQDRFAFFARKNLWWYPHGPSVYQGIRGACHFFYGHDLMQRLKGSWGLIRILPRMLKP
ncbi:aldehyde dehydrogenase family protein [Desulfobotulus sp. H1]|uniref:Aldehyde dehydrogenase family protein n=1 Tax=Desulfobotulus pelophilus TaxID=2823377 RepID=A0ABT3N7C4_9BACT|nr:aldehyde dehydrogenase family protein [Desulfobotulus pelophilus]MCW7753061.1 aldehyde dehydrogenase family protein [Desulfobotulus pelophilus]